MNNIASASKLPYYTADNSSYSWFGRAWRNAAHAIANHIVDVVAAVGGGPVGYLLAQLIEAGVNVIISGRPDVSIDPLESNVLTRPEQNQLNLYSRYVLLPTIIDIVKEVDDSIVVTIQNRGDTSAIVSNINTAFQKVATLRYYGYLVDTNGVSGKSKNYTSQLSALIVNICDYAEKALVIYAEENLVDHRLVDQETNVSSTKNIGNIATDFSGDPAIILVKTYVSKDTVLNDTQSTVTDINTNPNDPTPATTNTPNGDTPKKSSISKTAFVVVGILGIAYLMKPKEGKKNKK